MELTPTVVETERRRLLERTEVVVPLINEVRAELGDAFETDVESVTVEQYQEAIKDVFVDGDRAVNVAALAGLLRDLDVKGDYPGFVVDELLGRELAATIAGEQPLSTLAEATFHYADIHTHGDPDATAGRDDLDAALAAGVQTRLPGWEWQTTTSPFAVPPDER
jgi:hypothetical protein